MNRTDIIRVKLEEQFSPTKLNIIDDSAKHAGHAGATPGGESHFRIEIISKKFAGLSRVARHRLVNEALGDLFQQGLHALSIEAKDE